MQSVSLAQALRRLAIAIRRLLLGRYEGVHDLEFCSGSLASSFSTDVKFMAGERQM